MKINKLLCLIIGIPFGITVALMLLPRGLPVSVYVCEEKTILTGSLIVERNGQPMDMQDIRIYWLRKCP